MILVTATYSYELDISMADWDALSEAQRLEHLQGVIAPDAFDLAAETI